MAIINFLPLTYNIKWDGQSNARAAVDLPCYDAGATYSAAAYPVATAYYSIQAGPNSNNLYTFEREQGQRAYNSVAYDGTNASFTLSPDISLPLTVSSGVATIVFSTITATSHSGYAWSLKGVKGTSTQVLLRGRIQIEEQNPYRNSAGSSYVASGATAFGCF